MQTTKLFQVVAAAFTIALASCSRTDNPYEKIPNPPLVRATLHTVTVVSPDAGIPQRLEEAGYSRTAFLANYAESARVEAAVLKLPEASASTAVYFMAPVGQRPNVRLIIMPDAPPMEPVDDAVEAAFFRNVLGTDVPAWQGSKLLRNGAHVRSWTFLIDDVLGARKRFIEAGIPVTVDPVAITTPYLGDHRTLAIQGPGGMPIQLVQSVAR